MPGLPSGDIQMFALKDIPEVFPGEDLCEIISTSIMSMGRTLLYGDVVVLAQKIVSKAEDQFVDLKSIEPSQEAIELADRVNKDPRLVEVVLRESTQVLRHKRNLLITIHRLGIINANAGVDQSNVCEEDKDVVLLLPKNPDLSARIIRSGLENKFGTKLAVIINDTAGRAWRNGIVGFAIGVSGMSAIMDLRGTRDRFRRQLQATQVAVADQAAAAASMIQGQGAEGFPVVVIRGLGINGDDGTARDLIRSKEEDLFR